MINSIFKLRYITHGLYEWGKGYVSNDVAEEWRKFFDEVVFKVTLMFDPLDTSNDVARICERKEIYRTEGFKLLEEK